MKRYLPALLAFALTVAALLPPALSRPQFVDEQFYTWGGSYFLGRLMRLDFDPRPGPDPAVDPGWNPSDWWFASSPQAFRLLYAAVMTVARVPPPAKAFDWETRDRRQPDADIPRSTLLVVRLFSVACAAFGLAALALRFGWSGLFGLVLVADARARWSLPLAMAEGPLILALGLCVLAYGSRWFGSACGFAGSCKLTALGAWPLLLLPHASGAGRYARWIGLGSALALWVAINPGSWLAGGPLYLLTEVTFRTTEQIALSGSGPGVEGIYLPSWYLAPFKYGLVVAFAVLVRTYLHMRLARRAAVLQAHHRQ